jgi:hypothetical protein
MRRFSIAVAWIGFACIPTAMMSVLIFGCCALPFHHVIHRVFPVCTGIMKTHESHTPTTPATVTAKRAPVVFAKAAPKIATVIVPLTPRPIPLLRNRMTLGALRCDDDVGLHLLLLILLI